MQPEVVCSPSSAHPPYWWRASRGFTADEALFPQSQDLVLDLRSAKALALLTPENVGQCGSSETRRLPATFEWQPKPWLF